MAAWRPSLPGLPFMPRKAPPPRTLRIIKPNSVTLDGTGYGYCTVTTPAGIVSAKMVSYSFSTTEINPAVVPPQFTSYLDSAPNLSHYFESSGNGNRGSSDTTHEFAGSEPFTGEWRGGTPGSTATLTVVYMQTESTQL